MASVEAAEVRLPEHFGFCEGVEAAHRLLERTVEAAQSFDPPIPVYGYHGIVHNESVIAHHEDNGVVFVDDVEEMPDGEFIGVGSAHGSSPEVKYRVRQKGGLFIDGVCSLVTHTHKAARAARKNGEKLLYIRGSKANHDEVVGMRGHMDYYLDDGDLVSDPISRAELELPADSFQESALEMWETIREESGLYRVVGQTTLLAGKVSAYIEAIGEVVRNEQHGATIARLDAKRQVCFAVEDRQDGVEEGTRVEIGKKPADAVVVVTDPSSGNGRHYVEMAKELSRDGVEIIAVADPTEAERRLAHLSNKIVFLTASASTPDTDTREVVTMLGGDPASIPEERDMFNIPDTTQDDLRRRIKEWRAS